MQTQGKNLSLMLATLWLAVSFLQVIVLGAGVLGHRSPAFQSPGALEMAAHSFVTLILLGAIVIPDHRSARTRLARSGEIVLLLALLAQLAYSLSKGSLNVESAFVVKLFLLLLFTYSTLTLARAERNKRLGIGIT